MDHGGIETGAKGFIPGLIIATRNWIMVGLKQATTYRLQPPVYLSQLDHGGIETEAMEGIFRPGNQLAIGSWWD